MKIEYGYEEIKSALLGYINDDPVLKKVLKINLNVVSKIRAILEAVSRGIAEFVFSLMLPVYNNIFIDSSDEEALIQHLNDRGLEPWKEARKAKGKVRIGSTSLPTGEKLIPQLAIVAAAGGSPDEVKQFVLLSGGSIGPATPADTKGYYTVEIEIESLLTGEEYNVPAESINQLISDIPGVDVVYNTAVTSYGRYIETVDEVRERLKTNNLAAQQGKKSWFESKTLEFSFVSEVVVIPRYAGRGSVGIAFLTPSGQPTTEQKQTVANYFNSEDVDPAGAYNVVNFDMSQKVWNATVRIYWQGEAPTDADLNNAAQKYFDTLSHGEDMIEDQIITTLINSVGGIKRVEVLSHSGYVVAADEYPVRGTITWEKVEYAE